MVLGKTNRYVFSFVGVSSKANLNDTCFMRGVMFSVPCCHCHYYGSMGIVSICPDFLFTIKANSASIVGACWMGSEFAWCRFMVNDYWGLALSLACGVHFRCA